MIHKTISSGITSSIYSGTHSISRCKTTFGQAEHAISYNFLQQYNLSQTALIACSFTYIADNLNVERMKGVTII